MFKVIISYLMSILMLFIPTFSTDSNVSNFQSKSLEHDCTFDGHVPGTTMFELNCEMEGMEYSNCVYCGELLILNYLPPAGHDYYEESRYVGSCTEYSSVTYCCSRCGDCYTETSNSLGHDFEPWYIENATCGDNGYKIRYCNICGEYEDALIPATGEHNFGEWEITQYATCAQEGKKEHTCEVCGKSEEETIPKKIDHAFEPVEYYPPTCISNGYEVIKCSICGLTDKIDSEPSFGNEHSYSVTETVNATCFEDGYKKYTCKYCSDSYTETISANGSHTFGKWIITAVPNCTENGAQTRTCSKCSATETKAITAHGHNYSSDCKIEKEATCTETGLVSTFCTICGTKKTEEIPHIDHIYGEMIYQIHPTCTQPQIGYHFCVNCGEIEYLHGYAEHDFGDWVVTSLPNATLSGEKKHACSVCGHVETEVIPPVEFALGDTSGDGVVDQNDYNLIVEIANGTKMPTPEELYASDINQDGTVDGFDVIYFDLILNNYI